MTNKEKKNLQNNARVIEALLEKRLKSRFKKLKSIFVNPYYNSVELVIAGEDITFDNLAYISKLLKTKKINIERDVILDEGCETCSHGRKIERKISIGNADYSNLQQKEKVTK